MCVMKRAILTILFLGSLALPATLRAQNYSIDWYKVGGGGGTSTGGNYSVSGTIGQADAGAMSGGSYSITGGFWSLLSVVATPGSPTLNMNVTGNSVVLSWAVSAGSFTLESKPDLAVSSAWTPVTPPPTAFSGINYVTNPITAGSLFYRLRFP